MHKNLKLSELYTLIFVFVSTSERVRRHCRKTREKKRSQKLTFVIYFPCFCSTWKTPIFECWLKSRDSSKMEAVKLFNQEVSQTLKKESKKYLPAFSCFYSFRLYTRSNLPYPKQKWLQLPKEPFVLSNITNTWSKVSRNSSKSVVRNTRFQACMWSTRLSDNRGTSLARPKMFLRQDLPRMFKWPFIIYTSAQKKKR